MIVLKNDSARGLFKVVFVDNIIFDISIGTGKEFP